MPARADRIVWAVEAIGRAIPGMKNCLVQAIAAEAMLCGRAIHANCESAPRRTGPRELIAHAWLESKSKVLIGEFELDRYTPFVSPDLKAARGLRAIRTSRRRLQNSKYVIPMSGIVAVYYLDGRPADRGLVSAMLDAAAYRGPDGLNSWIEGPVALGHAMLRTTPEAIGESQPLVDEQAGLALTMDGRVDNRDELKELLERQGLRAGRQHRRGNRAARLPVPGRRIAGENSGDFAFALWDGRKHQTILRPRFRQRAAVLLLLRRPRLHLRFRTATDSWPSRACRARPTRRWLACSCPGS